MWRMQRGPRLRAHAMIGLRDGAAWVMWFLNDHALDVREFGDWESALRWSDRLRDQNWSVGWRLLADDDGAAPM